MLHIKDLLKDETIVNRFKNSGKLSYSGCNILDNKKPFNYMSQMRDFIDRLNIVDNKKDLKVLILGEGVGQLSKEIDNYLFNKVVKVSITGVEKLKDLENFRVKHDYKSYFKIIYQDAVDFINETKEFFDICLIDVFETETRAVKEVVDIIDTNIVNCCEHVLVNFISGKQKEEVFEMCKCSLLCNNFYFGNDILYFTNNEIKSNKLDFKKGCGHYIYTNVKSKGQKINFDEKE